MPSSNSDEKSQYQATVEDCPEEDTRQEDMPAHANISTKRSQGSDLRQSGKEKPFDVFSDSGYSSRTAATVSTADSAESSPSARKSSKVSASAPAPEPSKDSPSKKADVKSKSSKSEKPKSSRPKANVIQQELPTRHKSGNNIRSHKTEPAHEDIDEQLIEERRRRPHARPPPIDTQRSAVSDPVRSPPAASHSYHGPAVVQPAQSHRRRSSVNRPRPVSFHSADAGYYPNRVPESVHGPPPSNSAWANMNMSHSSTPVYHTPTGHYSSQHPMWQAPYQDGRSQPEPVDRTYSTRLNGRPTSLYGAPQALQQSPASLPVTKLPQNFTPQSDSQASTPFPSARYGPPAQIQNHPQYLPYSQPTSYLNQLAIEDDDDSSESGYEIEEYHQNRQRSNSRALMPPPPQIPQPRQPRERRPSAHPKYEHGSYDRNEDRYDRKEDRYDRKEHRYNGRDERYARKEDPYDHSEGRYPPSSPVSRHRDTQYHQERYPTSYESSSRHQSTTSSNRTKEPSYSSSKVSSRDFPPPTGRRNSRAYPDRVHDQRKDTRDRSDSDDYYSEDDEEMEEEFVPPPKPALRRGTSTRRTRTEDNSMQAQIRQAQEHQTSSEGRQEWAADALLRDKISKGTKYQDRVAFDVRSQKSSMTRQSKGGVTIMVQGDDDLNIKLDGNMDGQVLSFQKVEGGGTAITVGSQRPTEYHGSEKSASLNPARNRADSVRGSNKGSKTSKTSDHSHGSRRSRRDESVFGA